MNAPKRKRGSNIHAVLTGDLVGSTGLELFELERAREAVLHGIEELGAWTEDMMVGGAEFFRGDSWQVLLSEPRFFLRAALYLRASLRRERRDLDTRIGIGLGTVERIDSSRVSLSVGEAFTTSGRQLDAMSGTVGITVKVPQRALKRVGWIDPMTALCSAAMNHWSERQADIVCRMLVLPGPRQMDVAAELDISKQAVSKALIAVNFDAVLAALLYVEEIDWESVLQAAPTRRLV